jgi:phospholipid/cholesterol/gamma-HCH transport system substrate-binding protein
MTSGETTFATTAANNNALADTFHVVPTFLDETKATMTRLKAFAIDTDPLTKELEPVAHDLGPTLRSVRALSPDLRNPVHEPRATHRRLEDRSSGDPRRPGTA